MPREEVAVSGTLIRDLIYEWGYGTRFIKETRARIAHWAFEEIVFIGKPAIPFILEELKCELQEKRPPFGVLLLLRIVEPPPYVPNDRIGDMSYLASVYVQWGKDHKYIT